MGWPFSSAEEKKTSSQFNSCAAPKIAEAMGYSADYIDPSMTRQVNNELGKLENSKPQVAQQIRQECNR